MNSQKRLLLTLKYLWEKTDEEHPITLKEIGEYLQQNGIETTRKTLQADINLLMEFGIDIICNHSTQNQYHIGERVFEIQEVKLLVDAVQSARFITAKKSKTLIKKLSLFVGEPQADILKRQLYVYHRLKAGNEGIYFTVDLIHQAIRLKKRVTFQYYYYTCLLYTSCPFRADSMSAFSSAETVALISSTSRLKTTSAPPSI